MIIAAESDEGLVLIAQDDHAHLTGDLAARLADPLSRSSAFVGAARLHDNGWREADAAPSVDGDGRPHDFRSAPDDIYEEVWRRGISRAADLDDEVGLLVGLHGARFLGHRDGTRPLLRAERRREADVLARLGHPPDHEALPPELARASDWIAALDAVSLIVCGQLGDELSVGVAGERLTVRRDGTTVVLDPWPLRDDGGPVEVPARRVAEDRFADAGALWSVWAAGAATVVRRELRPPR